MEAIEKLVTDAILERSEAATLTIEGVDYPIAPPTLATIIMISELTADLPLFDPESHNLLNEVLFKARHCRVLGDIAAVLILGAKRANEQRKVKRTIANPQKTSYFSHILRSIGRKSKNEQFTTERENLAQIVLNCVSPSALQSIIQKRLIDMEVGDFFGLTASLNGRSLIKPTTREVETPSGE